MAPPLRLPPLVDDATEYRLSTGEVTILRGPATESRCSVRIHGDLVLKYLVRQVGGVRRIVRQDPPLRFAKTFCLHDPDSVYRSYNVCSNVIHEMMKQTPVLEDFDLADPNWDLMFLPHTIAMILVGNFHQAIERNEGLDTMCAIDVELPVTVTAVYNEAKALLHACQLVAKVTDGLVLECFICGDEIADGGVRLPCKCDISFHPKCLLGCLSSESKCPHCRVDTISSVLVKATGTPSGRFPCVEV